MNHKFYKKKKLHMKRKKMFVADVDIHNIT